MAREINPSPREGEYIITARNRGDIMIGTRVDNEMTGRIYLTKDEMDAVVAHYESEIKPKLKSESEMVKFKKDKKDK